MQEILLFPDNGSWVRIVAAILNQLLGTNYERPLCAKSGRSTKTRMK